MKPLGLTRLALLCLGLAAPFTGCNLGMETVAVETSAVIGQPFFLDVSTHQAWVNSERTLETSDARAELNGGCNAVLLGGPTGSTLSGMTIEWTPSDADAGVASFVVEFTIGCGEASEDVVNYEVPVKADSASHGSSNPSGTGNGIHDFDDEDDYAEGQELSP